MSSRTTVRHNASRNNSHYFHYASSSTTRWNLLLLFIIILSTTSPSLRHQRQRLASKRNNKMYVHVLTSEWHCALCRAACSPLLVPVSRRHSLTSNWCLQIAAWCLQIAALLLVSRRISDRSTALRRRVASCNTYPGIGPNWRRCRSNGEPTVHIGHTVGRARVQTRPCNTRYSGRPSTRSPSGAHVHERLVAFYTCTDTGYRRHQLSARGRSLGDPTSGN